MTLRAADVFATTDGLADGLVGVATIGLLLPLLLGMLLPRRPAVAARRSSGSSPRILFIAVIVVAVGAAALAHLSANVGLLVIWTATALVVGSVILAVEAFGMRRARAAQRVRDAERMSLELRVARATLFDEKDPGFTKWDCMPRLRRLD